MGCEVDIDPISTSGRKQTTEKMEIIQPNLSQTPAHVTRIPPEILGYIFEMTVEPVLSWDDDPRFAGSI
jgi:hypothetical protein